jgi:hypothetical protein
MESLNRRLAKLEEPEALKVGDALKMNQAAEGGRRVLFILPDNGRGPFKVRDPQSSRMVILPTRNSQWPDGVNVFATMHSPPIRESGKRIEITSEQWEELRQIEANHQSKDCE